MACIQKASLKYKNALRECLTDIVYIAKCKLEL